MATSASTTQRPWKNFKTDNSSNNNSTSNSFYSSKYNNYESNNDNAKKNTIINFEAPQTEQSTLPLEEQGLRVKKVFVQKKNDASKKIKKPKNKLSLNKYHQPIIQKMSEKKQLKKKARDLQRLIAKEDVVEKVKQEKEKELEEVKLKLAEKEKVQKRLDRKIKVFESKYKGVKEVEMKKVRRGLEKIERSLHSHLEQDDERDKLLAQKKEWQMKFNYIRHFPNDKKYMSLFPKVENEKMVAFRTKIMKDIQSRIDLKSRYLDKVELDPTQQQAEIEEKKQKKEQKDSKIMDKKKKSKKEQEEKVAAEDSDDSDSDDKMEIEEEEEKVQEKVKIPKLTKKIVDNFFVAPNDNIQDIQIKVVGRDGKIVKEQTDKNKKTFKQSTPAVASNKTKQNQIKKPSDSSSSDDSDSD